MPAEAGISLLPARFQAARDPSLRWGDVLFVTGGRPILLLVHREHPRGDRKAAEDIDAGQHHREQPVPPIPIAALAISAPTMITDEIALVTAISGVCSAGVTDQTT